MKTRATLLLLISVLLAEPLSADEYGEHRRSCRPVGSWLIDINFPATDFRFKQLLVLNADRTLRETNAGLHPNSPPSAAPNGALPTTGSDGYGSWKRMRGCRIQFSFLKLVFAGDAGVPPMGLPPGAPPPPPEGTHIGYFKVSGVAQIEGNIYVSELEDVNSELILGPDPFAPEAIRISTGPSESSGIRLFAND